MLIVGRNGHLVSVHVEDGEVILSLRDLHTNERHFEHLTADKARNLARQLDDHARQIPNTKEG